VGHADRKVDVVSERVCERATSVQAEPAILAALGRSTTRRRAKGEAS
jgi:hypothetical protein